MFCCFLLGKMSIIIFIILKNYLPKNQSEAFYGFLQKKILIFVKMEGWFTGSFLSSKQLNFWRETTIHDLSQFVTSNHWQNFKKRQFRGSNVPE